MSDQKAEEEAVFDRQMRLWGADAQQKIRSSRVLIRGKFQGLASELSKNLVLAGANVSLLDNDPATEEDVLTNIFLRIEDAGKSRAECAIGRLQEMNPFAQVKLVKGEVDNYSEYSLVVSVSESFERVEEVSQKCRATSVPLIFAHAAGLLAVAILDMGKQYKYAVENKQDEFKSASYAPLTDVFAFSNWSTLPTGRKHFPEAVLAILAWRAYEAAVQGKNVSPTKRAKKPTLEDFARDMFSPLEGKAVGSVDEVVRACTIFSGGKSFAPVSTVFGGLIGQEALKVATGQAEPLNNIVLFDGVDCSARVFRLPVVQ
jgi:ubiquitin-like 1-activating enzyme E1 A